MFVPPLYRAQACSYFRYYRPGRDSLISHLSQRDGRCYFRSLSETVGFSQGLFCVRAAPKTRLSLYETFHKNSITSIV
ncbi:hypothetical protein PoB_000143100 [Plakobranchus ocellatus]|uniref:Uncharacterized protein n=1 Tax=Plakobranchus ocellatus TaxID=259542 RepID=A0AAV3XVU4_9GAST|nr:hypothetical protein PoB_000143100 [Plakobranchus ocellatus]